MYLKGSLPYSAVCPAFMQMHTPPAVKDHKQRDRYREDPDGLIYGKGYDEEEGGKDNALRPVHPIMQNQRQILLYIVGASFHGF